MKIPHYFQEKDWTCGAASMRMALESLDKRLTEEEVIYLLKTDKIRGTYHKNFPLVAEKLGFNYLEKENSSTRELENLFRQGFVVIVNFMFDDKEDHYAVLRGYDKDFVYLNDPWYGKGRREKIIKDELLKIWFDVEGKQRWFFAIQNNNRSL